MSHVLIVDDEESICWGLERLLVEEGHEVSVASSAEQAFESAGRRRPDLAVLDVRLPGLDGLSAMHRLTSVAGPIPIIIITAFGSLDTAVTAVRNGAFDYLSKPFDLEQAAAVVRRALGHSEPAVPAMSDFDDEGGELLGASPVMQEVFKRIALVASTDAPVLITGESGTGKELVARAIHRHSARSDRPLVAVSLASLSPSLVESELFGHVRGSFTGADNARIGLLELADGATVLFDETGDIPPPVQVKLLRVLEQHEVTPVGGTEPRGTRFRVIAATNHDLGRSLREGTFREDLFFRLAAFEIHLPPLRERSEDIPLLSERFLRNLRPPGGSTPRLTDAAREELGRRAWPGNVRELRHAVEHGALLARGGPIEPGHLPPPRALNIDPTNDPAAALDKAVRDWSAAQLTNQEPIADLYHELLSQIEPALFRAVLGYTGGNRVAAASVLGIDRSTLRKKLL